MGNSQGKPVVFTDEVNLNHFRLLRVVGKGAFGKVRIVERKDSGLTFALKYIRKDEVIRSESVRNIVRERRMLEHLNHPFLCNLRYSFQDVEYIYVVMDLMQGGDLRFHITRKAFTEEAIRFWIAELACALLYIHSQGIVHRDLKPDNVLLDAEGHAHLADFNVASDFTPSKPLTSKSGTLAYLAPEVFEGKGYLNEVDWWSLGVTFYECLFNKRPFDGKGHEQLAESIKAANPKYFVTQPPISMPCLRALTDLIQRDKRRRIGAAGFETFTNHEFFRCLDFNALERKQLSPIFVPSSEKANFDATYDLEELLLEEAPLEARTRRQKPRAELKADASDKEIRENELHKMIETMFEPFDYTTNNYDVHAGAAVAGLVPDEHLDLKPSNSSQRSQTRSATGSPDGSPPLRADTDLSYPKTDQPGHQHEYYTPADAPPVPKSNPTDTPHRSHSHSHASTSYSRPVPPQKLRAPNRKTSKGGGVQMVLDETGSWSDLADQSSTLSGDPPDGPGGRPGKGSSGMLGFLGRKKGRDRSPKPQEPGVLGKEGARRILN